MKTIIFPLVTFTLLMSCEEETPQPVQQIDTALDPYVSTFYDEAIERGVTIPRNLVATFKDEIQGISKSEVRDGQNYMYVNRAIFMSADQAQKEAIVVHRMASLFVMEPEPEVIDRQRPELGLFPHYEREAFFDSIFD